MTDRGRENGRLTELDTFHRFIGQQLADGSQLTPEECLRLWRVEHPTASELSESLIAVQRALAQAEEGKGKTLHEFDRDFRPRHGIDENS
jgi:hypothetical protein